MGLCSGGLLFSGKVPVLGMSKVEIGIIFFAGLGIFTALGLISWVGGLLLEAIYDQFRKRKPKSLD